jgi:hypothetical protein
MAVKALPLWGFIFVFVLAPQALFAAEKKKGTITMDVLEVEGELQKPQASYIVQRSNKISLSEDLKKKAPRVTSRIAETLQDDLFDPQP